MYNWSQLKYIVVRYPRDMEQHKKRSLVNTREREQSPFRTGQIFLYIGFASISILFFVLTATFAYARFVSGAVALQLPLIFHANTVIIIASSFTLRNALGAIKQGRESDHAYALGTTLLLGMLFLIFQYLGWREIVANGFNASKDQSGLYLIFVSVVHAGHILGGLAALAYSLFRSVQRMNDPVKELIFSAQLDNTYRLGLLTKYWHFVDILWIYLYLFFVVASLF